MSCSAPCGFTYHRPSPPPRYRRQIPRRATTEPHREHASGASATARLLSGRGERPEPVRRQRQREDVVPTAGVRRNARRRPEQNATGSRGGDAGVVVSEAYSTIRRRRAAAASEEERPGGRARSFAASAVGSWFAHAALHGAEAEAGRGANLGAIRRRHLRVDVDEEVRVAGAVSHSPLAFARVGV